MDMDFTCEAMSRFCPSFCLHGQAIKEFLNTQAARLDPGAIQVRWDAYWRTDEPTSSRVWLGDCKAIQAADSPRAIVAKA